MWRKIAQHIASVSGCSTHQQQHAYIMKHCAGCELMLGANDIEQCERIQRLRKDVFINTALSSDEMNISRVQPFIFEHLSNGYRWKYVPAGSSATNHYTLHN